MGINFNEVFNINKYINKLKEESIIHLQKCSVEKLKSIEEENRKFSLEYYSDEVTEHLSNGWGLNYERGFDFKIVNLGLFREIKIILLFKDKVYFLGISY